MNTHTTQRERIVSAVVSDTAAEAALPPDVAVLLSDASLCFIKLIVGMPQHFV